MNKNNFDEFIKNIIIDICTSFAWHKTSEGFEYWFNTVMNLFDFSSGSTYSSYSCLSLGFYLRNNKNTLNTYSSDIPNKELCEKIDIALAHNLIWEETPQGHDYWKERWIKLLEMANIKENSPEENYDRAMEILL